MAVLLPDVGALPARSVSVVPTVITLVVSEILAVGVNVPVQVTPPFVDVIAVNVPLAKVRSLLLKPVTASLNVIVKVLVSPTVKALSDIVILETTGSLVSIA